MHAIVCEALGGVETLSFKSLADPVAAAGGVVVTLKAAALNFPDLLTIAGTYQHKRTPPFTPGMEGAGVVVETGAGVDRAWVGRRVIVSAFGTFAERIAVPVAALSVTPEAWSDAEAAAFPVIGKTAYHALVQRARVVPGETLLVNGASGGTGHMAVKIGKALGARVIATGSNPAKLEVVRELGADAVIALDAGDAVERIKAENGGRGVDVVFDPVGGAAFDVALKATAFGARVAIIGFTSGGANEVRTNYALIKGLSLLGIRAGEAARFDPAIQADYDARLMPFAGEHNLRPRIAASYPLAEAADALRHLQGRGFVGKIVVTM